MRSGDLMLLLNLLLPDLLELPLLGDNVAIRLHHHLTSLVLGLLLLDQARLLHSLKTTAINYW